VHYRAKLCPTVQKIYALWDNFCTVMHGMNALWDKILLGNAR